MDETLSELPKPANLVQVHNNKFGYRIYQSLLQRKARNQIHQNAHPSEDIDRKTRIGKEIDVDIEPTDKVKRIKEKIQEKEGVPPQQQRLIFCSGKELEDEKTVADYKMEEGSVLFLLFSLRR